MRRAPPRAIGRGLSRRSGTSLVELLVTMTILGLGLVAVASMFTTSYKTQVQAHFASVATDTVVTRIEEMKSAGYNGIREETFPHTFQVPELPAGMGTVSYQPYPNTDTPNQYLVEVTVSWGGGPGIAGQVSLPLVLSNHS